MSAPRVLVYATGWCPFCERARGLLKRKGVEFEEIDVEDAAQREAMVARTGRRTVPQIFVGGTHVGGFDDLQALDGNGELDRLLQGAR